MAACASNPRRPQDYRGEPASKRAHLGLENAPQDDLERAGVSGARNENNGYYRFLKDIDVTDPDGKQRILAIVDILHKQACRCVVDPAPEAESAVANFLDELRAMDSLHFEA